MGGQEQDAFLVSDGFFFFKQKTAYEITTGDWSSDVCSSDLPRARADVHHRVADVRPDRLGGDRKSVVWGKSVGCCVDLGGRRIIKKKKMRKNIKIIMLMWVNNKRDQRKKN